MASLHRVQTAAFGPACRCLLRQSRWHCCSNRRAAARAVQEDNSYKYDEVKRWGLAKKLAAGGQLSASLLDCDRLIMPVHLPNHWVAAMVDLKNERLTYYDSMGVRDPSQCQPTIGIRIMKIQRC